MEGTEEVTQRTGGLASTEALAKKAKESDWDHVGLQEVLARWTFIASM